MVVVMKEIIIKNMSFSYLDQNVFSHVNLEIEDGAFVTILGSTGSGKTTFANILMGILPFEGSISIHKMVLEKKNYPFLCKKIVYIPENFYDMFMEKTVLEEIVYHLKTRGYKKNVIQTRLTEIIPLFHLDQDLNKKIKDLNISKKAMVKLASSLIRKPKILLLDSIFPYMDIDDKKRAIYALRKYNKKDKMIILNTTSCTEDVLWGNKVLLLDRGIFSLYCKKDDIYNYEKEFQKANIELPFMFSLSKNLSYYGLLDRAILNMKEMVNTLWK